jgi:hypothetical protein
VGVFLQKISKTLGLESPKGTLFSPLKKKGQLAKVSVLKSHLACTHADAKI